MLYFASIANARTDLFARVADEFATEHQGYYGTPAGSSGGWGFISQLSKESQGGAQKRLSETIDTLEANHNLSWVRAGAFAVWVSCAGNLYGLVEVEGEVFILLYGRRHGLRSDFLTDGEKCSCQTIVYETMAPGESPFAAGVDGGLSPNYLTRPPTQGELIEGRFEP
jgi:hypothetical protein